MSMVTVRLAPLVRLALLVVVVESISRMWLKYRRRYYVFPPGMRLHVQPHRGVFPQLPHTARFLVNREGERGDELPSSTDGLYRILVAGGSQTEGYFLDQDTTWPGAMQRLLDRPDRLSRLGASRVHVGCLARSGFGSEALDVMFSHVLDQYPRLQLIIVVVGVADVVRWMEQGMPRTPTPVGVGDVFRCHPEGPFRWTPRKMATTQLLARWRRRWLQPLDVDAGAGRWVGRARTMRANAKTVRHEVVDPTPMLVQFEHHLRRVLTRAQAHADRVLFVRQPWFDKDFSLEEAAAMWHGGVGQAWRDQVTVYYSFDVFSRVMRQLDERAAMVAQSCAVEQLNLMSIVEPSLENYYDVIHLTDDGARRVAEAVTAAIVRERLPQRDPADADAPCAFGRAVTLYGSFSQLVRDSHE
jgi:hypothetical protein